jgi:hypothetical protein
MQCIGHRLIVVLIRKECIETCKSRCIYGRDFRTPGLRPSAPYHLGKRYSEAYKKLVGRKALCKIGADKKERRRRRGRLANIKSLADRSVGRQVSAYPQGYEGHPTS